MTFTLSEQEANIILQSLGKQPFEIVFQIIASIQKQAQEQMKSSEDSDVVNA